MRAMTSQSGASAGPGFRHGARVGVDVGDVRVGLAVCDPAGILATPVETVQRGRGDVDRVLDLVVERDAIEVVVGLPVTLAGRTGPAAEKATAFARAIADRAEARRISVLVRLNDERLTTVSAERVLRERGRKGRDRRAVVDQAAAVEILQYALETERTTGVAPGTSLPGPAERPGP